MFETARREFLRLHADAGRTAMVVVPLIALLVGGLLWLSAGVPTFSDDAAQYMSTANHILAGDGARTSVLYYENQLSQAAPAAQTVWPAGLPVLTAAVSSLTGLGVDRALLLIGILAHFGTAACLAGIIRLWRLSGWIALAVGAMWLMNVPAWLAVTRGFADPLYQMFGASIALGVAGYFQPGRSGSRLWIWFIGCSLIGAVLARYQAIALIPPLAMALTVGGLLGKPWRPRISAAIIGVLPGVLTLAALFGRNWLITGQISGGAQPARGQTLAEVASRISWVPEFMQGIVLWGLVLSCLVCTIGALVLWMRDNMRLREAGAYCPLPVRAVSVFCLLAFASNITLLLVLAVSSTAYVIEMRYLIVCAMFLVAPSIWLIVDYWTRSTPRQFQWQVPAQLAAIIAVATAVQLVTLQRPFVDRLAGADPTQVQQILAISPSGRQSALAMLRELTDGQRLMSTHAHSLSMLTDATVIGVPVSAFAAQSWDESQIRALADRHEVKYLVACRAMQTWVYRDLINKMLDTNQCPNWLEPLVATPELFIARVAAQSQPGSGSDPNHSAGVKPCELPGQTSPRVRRTSFPAPSVS